MLDNLFLFCIQSWAPAVVLGFPSQPLCWNCQFSCLSICA